MIFILLLLTTFLFYLPILLSKINVLARGNDLQEQFWPVFYFIKKSFWQTGGFPLWNNMWFSGMPLLPDPQFSLFYPLNWLFIFFAADTAFLVSFGLHSLLGACGAYLLAKFGLGLKRPACLFATILYVFMPKFAGYLEAGHYGLIVATGWLPYAVLSTLKIAKSPRFAWVTLLAFSLSSLFFTHTINFLVVTFFCSVLFAASVFLYPIKKWWTRLLAFIGGGVLTTFLSAVTLLPQLAWIPHTTRHLLLEDSDVYPKWNSLWEFFLAVLWPWRLGVETLDTEKWIVVGVIPMVLAIVGFFKLPLRAKVILVFFFMLLILVVLNNLSPFYSILMEVDWYVLMRVTTRLWIVVSFAVVFLAASGLQTLLRRRFNKPVVYLLATCAVFEVVALSWGRLSMSMIHERNNLAPIEVYQFLSKDGGLFRVFCVNRCLSQQESAKFGLQLAEGYNTFQQENYFEQFIQISQVYWKKYTLALPPFSIYQFRQIQPFAPSLADFNIKYVVSPHPLTDPKLVEEFRAGDYRVYRNTLVLARAYFEATLESSPILRYSPNEIAINTERADGDVLVVSEVWSPGWNAYLNGRDRTEVLETKSHTRMIKIDAATRFVELKYEPVNFKMGLFISGATFISLLAFLTTKLRFSSFKRLFS